MVPVLEILSTSPIMTLQDAGRSGLRRFGVPPAGVLDRHSAREANRLVDNPSYAPVLEILLQGTRLRCLERTWLGFAGAHLSQNLDTWSARVVEAGEELVFAEPGPGVCAYVAIPGGFCAPRFFGSVSIDPRNGLGEPLKRGSLLHGKSPLPTLGTGIGRRWALPGARRNFQRPRTYTLLPGPQFDAFSDSALAALVEQPWEVSGQSDRTGYRLSGPVLQTPESGHSEPVLPGTLQVPGNGQPIVTLNDGPTVGGYPKIAILKEDDRDWLVQCAPGSKIHFEWQTR